MIIVLIQTKKDAIRLFLIDLFESLGVSPVTGFAILFSIVLLLRIKSFIRQRKAKENYKGLEVFEDLALVLVASIMIYLLFAS